MYAAVFGGLNLFEFGDSVKCSHVACSDMLVNRFFPSMRLAWTGTQRQSSTILASQISLKDEKLPLYRQMKNLAYEGFELVNDMQNISSIKRFGALLKETQSSNMILVLLYFPTALKVFLIRSEQKAWSPRSYLVQVGVDLSSVYLILLKLLSLLKIRNQVLFGFHLI